VQVDADGVAQFVVNPAAVVAGSEVTDFEKMVGSLVPAACASPYERVEENATLLPEVNGKEQVRRR